MAKRDKTVGRCCKNLGLSVSPDELALSYRNFVQGGGKYDREDRGLSLTPGDCNSRARSVVYTEIHLIFPMLKFLYADNVHPNGDVKSLGTVYHYSCRHFDDKLKKCAIYDIRPRLCVTFPILDGSRCQYSGCACPSDGRREWAKKQADDKKLARRCNGLQAKDLVKEEERMEKE